MTDTPAATDSAPADRPADGPQSPGWLHLPGAVWAILILCLLPELVLQGADHGFWGSARWRPLAYAEGAFWAGLLYGWAPNYPGQPVVMFFSYAWLHAGLSHLMGNLLVLTWLGPRIVERIGARGMLAVWLAAALGGAVAFGGMTTSPAPMVGASGALFGLAGAWIMTEAQARRAAGQRRRRVLLVALGQALGLAGLNLLSWVLAGGQLAWQTHLGGALAGVALTLALLRKSKRAAPGGPPAISGP